MDIDVHTIAPKIYIDHNELIDEISKQMGSTSFLKEVLLDYDCQEVFAVLDKDELEEYLRDNYDLKI